MPEDVNARIIVTTEASAAKQGIDKVKSGLKGITDARERDLRIAQAKSRMEIAEYQSSIAAQKAYNAELQLETAEKLKQLRIKRGADADEIKKRTERIQQFRGEVLKLQQAEAAANLQAYKSKKAYEDLLTPLDEATESTDEATDGTKKLTFAQVAARMVGRALGIELSGSSQAMLALGIAGAAAAAAVKLVNFAYDNWREGLAEAADLEHRNSESILEATDRLSERIEKEKEALETVEKLGNKQNRTVDETVSLSRAIRLLGGDFAGLAKSADLANGGVADFSKISEAAAKKQYAAKLRQLQATYNQLSANEEAQVTIRDTAGIPLWFDGNLRLGGEQESKQAQEKINEIAEKRLEIQRKINELKQSETERLKDQEVKEKAIVTVSNKNIDRRLEDLENQRKIQNLINSGKEREAEIIKIRNQLDKEALKLRGKELEIFNSRRGEIERSMLESYDQKAAEKAEKDRLKAAEKAEKDRIKLVERGIKAEEKAYQSLYDRVFTYRKTVQDAITSRSSEGFALESRMFLNTSVSMNDNPAKDTAANTKKMLTELSAMKNEIHNLKTALTSSGIKITGLSTHKYA